MRLGCRCTGARVQHHPVERDLQLVHRARRDAGFAERIELQGDLARPAGQLLKDMGVGGLGVGVIHALARAPGQEWIPLRRAASNEGGRAGRAYVASFSQIGARKQRPALDPVDGFADQALERRAFQGFVRLGAPGVEVGGGEIPREGVERVAHGGLPTPHARLRKAAAPRGTVRSAIRRPACPA
jgi:hypothetical protein